MNYLFIGVLISFGLFELQKYSDKMNLNDDDDEPLSNMFLISIILLWPVLVLSFIYTFITGKIWGENE